MGNCFNRQSPVSCADDRYDEEWEWPGETGKRSRRRSEEEVSKKSGEEHELLKEKGRVVVASTEVKIKIAKKQLEELLRRVDSEGLPIQQVIARLLLVGAEEEDDDMRRDRCRHWRPALQSIAEAAAAE